MIGRRRRWINDTCDRDTADIVAPSERPQERSFPSTPKTITSSRQLYSQGSTGNVIMFEHEEGQQHIVIDTVSVLEGGDFRPSKDTKRISFGRDDGIAAVRGANQSYDVTQYSPTAVVDISNTHYGENQLLLRQELGEIETFNLDGCKSDDLPSCKLIEVKEIRHRRWGKMIDECDWKRLYISLIKCKHQRIFLSANMVVNAESNATVLHLAARNTPTALLLLLLDVITTCSVHHHIGSATNITHETNPNKYFICGDDDGNTPLHLVCANLERTTIAESEEMTIDFSVVKNLLVLGPEALGMENKNGDTPLHLLLSSNAFQEPPNSETSKTAISSAVEAICAVFGMAKDIALKQNMNGLTPLHVAIANHCPKRILLRFLAMAPNAATIADNDGMNSLHYIAAFGVVSWTFVEHLVNMHPELICQQTIHGDTPLHLLIANTSLAFFPGMTQDLSKTFTYHDSRHTMKLLTVLLGRSNETKQSLLVQNVHADTPLHFCAKMNSPSMVTQALMESYHAHSAATIENGLKMTPLRIAMSTLFHVGGSCDAVGLRNALCNVVALAIPESCEQIDSDGLSPLMHAVQSKKWSSWLVNTFLQADRDCAKITTPDGFLALHFACQNNKLKSATLRELINAYPLGLKAVTKDLNTPLHVAAIQGVESTLQILIKRDPKAVQLRNADGEWPIDLAIKHCTDLSVLEVFDLSKFAPKKRISKLG